MEKKKDRILGSVIGLALGDALGAPYEGGVLERCLWSIIGKEKGKLRWTDDTQMTIDVIESLVEVGSIDQNDLAHRFAKSYEWSRGYGPGAAKLLKLIRKGQSWKSANISIYPDGSYGNGGAMRSSIVGLFLVDHSDGEIVKAAGSIAEITHAHPLGKDGAALIALSTALVCQDLDSSEIIDRLLNQIKSDEFQKKLLLTKNWINEGTTIDRKLIIAHLGNGISAVESCVTSLYLALLFREQSFENLIAFTLKIGGDVDTITAMAGAIWGAARGFGELPENLLGTIEQYNRLVKLASLLSEVCT